MMLKSLVSSKTLYRSGVIISKYTQTFSNFHSLIFNQNYSSLKPNRASMKNMKSFKFSDYDCIGFDLDSTIIRYNVKNLVLLEYDVITNFLINKKGYEPTYLKEPLTEKDLDFLQKGLFFDFHRGNIVKLTPDGKIHSGSHGTKLLSAEEINEIYPNGEWDMGSLFSQNPLITWNGPYSLRIRTLLDVFDMPAGLVWAKVVDTLDAKNGKPLDEYNIWPDILDAFSDMYARENFKNGTGHFFSALKNNPGKYINKCDPATLDWIKKLRTKKKTFLITGSNYDFVKFTTNYAFGEGWESLFDIIICYARKPGFFTDARPFYSLKDDYEHDILSSKQLKVGGVYNQGNWKDLLQFFSRITGEQNPKCLYIGDNLLQDVYAPTLVNCDTMVISAEQYAEGMIGHNYCHESSPIINSKIWGSYFTLTTLDTHKDSFWNHVIKKHSKICVPELEMITEKQLDEPMECFAQEDEDKELNGYQPAKPLTLSKLK